MQVNIQGVEHYLQRIEGRIGARKRNTFPRPILPASFTGSVTLLRPFRAQMSLLAG